MSRLSKLGIICLLTGILGLGAGISPFGLYLEENIGLDLLFQLRGAKTAPSDVVVVAMDQESSGHIGLTLTPEKWPRSLYAGLIESLIKAGAAVIAFDILFDEPRSLEYDDLFAEAIGKAGNVVLCESIKRDHVPLTDRSGAPAGSLMVERLVQPIPKFARSAAASAPFPLPKVPVKVSQYWTFKVGAGDKPTLPITAFQVFTLELYDEFVYLLENLTTSRSVKLLPARQSIVGGGSLEQLIRALRDTFNEDPLIGEKMLEALDDSDKSKKGLRKNQLMRALVRMYQGPDARYINFYGPPGTITTIPYERLLETDVKPGADEMHIDLHGKAVFVGISGHKGGEHRDGFYTVFSQPNGMDIGGVEVAATAFANLLEGTHVQPLSAYLQIFILLFWGLAIGLLCYLLPALLSAAALMSLGTLYLFIALYEFEHTGTWYPLVIPLFMQSPAAFLTSFLWKYSDANRERKNIRRAFGLYLPDRVVDQLAKDMKDITSDCQVLYGTCMCTDGEQYAALSEKMEPNQLSNFLNRYYEVLFEPVKKYGGTVSDIIGDAMMATWAGVYPDATLRSHACLAALDIANAVRRFNALSGPLQLPTRIGMHWGDMSVGNIGGVNHYEYRPVGDTVNTAARIEGLNKLFGTQILLSDKVVDQLDCFLTRELGEFILAGKSRPVVIHELMGHLEIAGDQQKCLCAAFAQGLAAYKNQSWEQAIKWFKESLAICAADGPALFYLALCKEYRQNQPGKPWNGVVRLSRK